MLTIIKACLLIFGFYLLLFVLIIKLIDLIEKDLEKARKKWK